MQYQSFVSGSGISGATGPTGATGAITPWVKISTTTTAVANTQYLVDTSGGAFTLTLPATPNSGSIIVIADDANFGTNNLTVARNGSTIQGIADNLAINIGNSLTTLVYDGSTWRVSTNSGPSGATGATGPTGPTGATGAGATGATGTSLFADSNNVIFLNNTLITSNTTLSPGKGAFSVGPISVNTGIQLIVSSNTRYVVL
jgi:hypothetical protein